MQGGKAAPFPACVALALQLMGVLTSQPQPGPLQANKKRRGLAGYAAGLIFTLQVQSTLTHIHCKTFCTQFDVC